MKYKTEKVILTILEVTAVTTWLAICLECAWIAVNIKF